MPDKPIYTTGGTVQAGDGLYITRQADEELLQLCRNGRFAYVLTSRQMGKSSLMKSTAAALREEGTACAIVDLTDLGTSLDAGQWYSASLPALLTACNYPSTRLSGGRPGNTSALPSGSTCSSARCFWRRSRDRW